MLRVGREVFLAALGLPLETLDDWVIDRLTSILEEHEFHAGQTLFTAGEPAEFVYFMQDGEVRLTRDGGASWIQRGRWFLGGFDALSDRPAARTVTALRDFSGMRVPVVAWVEMLEDSFQLARSAVVNLSRAVTRLEMRVAAIDLELPRAPSRLSKAPAGTLGLVERLALMLDVGALRATGVQALVDLAAVSGQVSFAAGDVLVQRGVEQGQLIQIVDGEALAEHEGPAIQRRFGPGELVCSFAILGGLAGSWQARAVTPVVALSLPIEALFDLMEEHFELVRATLTTLGAWREVLLERLASQSRDLVLT